MFENKLNNICDFVVLLIAPTAIRKKRALNRSGMDIKILNKIIRTQTLDKERRKRSHVIINNNKTKKDFIFSVERVLTELIKWEKL